VPAGGTELLACCLLVLLPPAAPGPARSAQCPQAHRLPHARVAVGWAIVLVSTALWLSVEFPLLCAPGAGGLLDDRLNLPAALATELSWPTRIA